MSYNWQIIIEDFSGRSVTFADGESQHDSRPTTAHLSGSGSMRPSTALRPGSALSSLISDVSYTPFSIEPELGSILPGKVTTFKVKFSPLDVQDYDARLICRYVVSILWHESSFLFFPCVKNPTGFYQM